MSKIKSILVVDDEGNSCLGLKVLLGREGYEVACVGNGREGLDYLKDNEAQLVISDIRMPVMDGLSFLKQIKKDYPQTQVILMTAFGALDSYIDAMNKGAYEYLIKPLKMNELRRVIERLENEEDVAPVGCERVAEGGGS